MTAATNSTISNLLVVVDDALSMPYLMEKAARLAGESTKVHVVQVIYEGIADIPTSVIEDSAKLKSFILASAESRLEDALDNYRSRFVSLESATLWNPRAWEAVLHAADNVDADIVLRATSEQEGLGGRVVSVVRTPDEWNLLRHAQMPVMLVKAAAWPTGGVVLCALDLFDDAHENLSIRVLIQAAEIARLLESELDVVYAYPLFEPWVGELGAVKSYSEIKVAVEEDARDRMDRIAQAAAVRFRHLHLEEGQTGQVLARLVEDSEASLLVLGTHAREGVRGVLLGNTSERILHAVDCDVVTMHAS